MIREIKIQSKINRMKFLVIFDENDCIFLNMVIFWMLLDVVIGFICLLSGDINLIGTACYHTTRRADRRCCFFPGRRRSGRGHCGRRSRDEAQIGPKEVKASKRQRLQRERLQIIFVHLFFCSHHFWSLRISQIFMENHLNHLDKRLSQPSGCYGCSKMCNFSLYFSYFSHFD